MVELSVDWITKPSGITKCANLVLNIIGIALLSNYTIPGKNLDQGLTIVTATGGFILVDALFIVGYILENTHGKAKLQDTIASVVGAILLVAAGAMAVVNTQKWRGEAADALSGYGAVCFINAVLYGVHAFLAFTGK